ncbi:Rieske (2Fe-2S) protein [Streptomyces sp. NPDC049555]|uniref:aromatic ring-hydroxylating oxygenase subunit alpha n=1 Tax=Streptomyces sp. NPDC049555 TaxID=3154930 RepID=UPI00342EF8EF
MSRSVPGEGEDGTFSRNWYPLCLSDEVGPGTVRGVDLLGDRVVVFRGARGGPARVLSAYCAHVGADLSVGDVVGERLRCRYHRWQYDGSGRCAATGIGDPVPPGARLLRHPSAERHGIVWAFHGDKPLYDLPTLGHPDDDLVLRHTVLDEAPVDPWIVAAQTMDVQHFLLQHDFALDPARGDPNDALTAGPYVMGYPLAFRTPDGSRLEVRVEIHGTNVFRQTGTLDGRWFCWLTSLRCVRPGVSRPYFVLGVRKGDEDLLERAAGVMTGMLADDAPVLLTMRFRIGRLTRSDRTLARYLHYVRRYPRGAPATA